MPQTTECFHCGESVADATSIFASLGSASQPVCCLGCKAVVEFIHGSGLDAFYAHRSTPGAEDGLRATASDWSLYEDADLIHRYVHTDGNSAVATIDIGGMYCAACVWLLDNALARLDAVESLSVTATTHRAVIRWDRTRLSFSQLLEAISRVGFTPSPTGAVFSGDSSDGEYRRALRRLIVAAAAGMQVMMFAVALYAGDYYGIEADIEQFLRIISLLVCLPIVFYSARPFFAGAYRGLRARAPGMDLPVAIAITSAFLASVFTTLVNSGPVYFDSVAMFVLFLSGTRYLEMRVRHRSEDHIQALARLLPETVMRLRHNQPELIALDKLRVGDVVMIRPGDVMPADGLVCSGDLLIDESLLTGESMPVARSSGMEVFAGGINRAGNASIEITLTGASTSLAEIGRLLERAKADRPPIALLADKIASKFVIGVLLIATITGIIWLNIEPERAFEIVLATLVVTCPCALSLATPAALAAATSRLARDGFLLVRSRVLEVLIRKVTIVFDKTGTLTEGRPRVAGTSVLTTSVTKSADDYLALAAEIETVSEHVLARAFGGFHKAGRYLAEDLVVQQGRGVEAIVDGQRYRIGNARFVAELCGAAATLERSADAWTEVYLGDEKEVLARFSIRDELRSDAQQAVGELQRLGYRVMIASGDRDAVVETVAKTLGIQEWHGQLSPADKLALVSNLQKQGNAVVMIGDGVNDAPVLAAADTSIAMDAGTALARASADAIVLGKRLSSVVNAIDVAAKTRRVIRQNIAWAILYNLVAVPLAASGILAPWMAAVGMSASSLLVVVNALRLQGGETPGTGGEESQDAASLAGEVLV